jgi:hypothetical protein
VIEFRVQPLGDFRTGSLDVSLQPGKNEPSAAGQNPMDLGEKFPDIMKMMGRMSRNNQRENTGREWECLGISLSR